MDVIYIVKSITYNLLRAIKRNIFTTVHNIQFLGGVGLCGKQNVNSNTLSHISP